MLFQVWACCMDLSSVIETDCKKLKSITVGLEISKTDLWSLNIAVILELLYTQRILFEILSNPPEIRLYSDWLYAFTEPRKLRIVNQKNPRNLVAVFQYLFPLRNLYTQRNLFKILLNQTNIRLYLPVSDWFGTKRTSVWC